jgi:hypothetical protein
MPHAMAPCAPNLLHLKDVNMFLRLHLKKKFDLRVNCRPAAAMLKLELRQPCGQSAQLRHTSQSHQHSTVFPKAAMVS